MTGVYQPTEFTALQRRLTLTLERLGFYVEEEVPVGAYRLDCYVRELHMAFEADGPMHRGFSAQRRDRKRDAWIREVAGIPVIRVDGKLLAPDRGDMLWFLIHDNIEVYAASAEQRRAQGISI